MVGTIIVTVAPIIVLLALIVWDPANLKDKA